MTKGVFEVSEITAENCSKEELLEIAAYAESSSTHPIAKSLLTAYGVEIDREIVKNIRELGGSGVVAEVDDKKVVVGNSKLMAAENIDFSEIKSIGTVAYIAVDGEYYGCIIISDKEKSTSKKAITALKNAGISKTVMLTGDRKAVADSVAKFLGVDEVHSELLPDGKVEIVENLLKDRKGSLIFVGDGINDAPVLSRADVGIAMGAMGSDAAIESADVVLMDDDPMKVAKAVNISRKVMRIIYQNIVFAIGVKILCLILGAFGYANMWLAIFADVGVMVLAVLNAIRCLFVKKI